MTATESGKRARSGRGISTVFHAFSQDLALCSRYLGEMSHAICLALLSHQDPQFGEEIYHRLRQIFSSERPRMAYLPSDFVRQSPYFSAQRIIHERYGIALDDLVEVTDGFQPE